MSTTLPALALVVAAWAYGAQDIGLRIQREANDRERELHQGAVEAQERTIADLRGLVAFEAEHDGDWNVTLQKRDGRPFEVDNLTLIPRFQVDLDEGPFDGAEVIVQPRYSPRTGVAEIRDARGSICHIEEPFCAARPGLIGVTLEFLYEGERHRVVANSPE